MLERLKENRADIANSFWLLFILTVFFNWIGFLYAGIRARHRIWFLSGLGYAVPFILMLLLARHKSALLLKIDVGLLFSAWLVSAVQAFMIYRLFLERIAEVDARQESLFTEIRLAVAEALGQLRLKLAALMNDLKKKLPRLPVIHLPKIKLPRLPRRQPKTEAEAVPTDDAVYEPEEEVNREPHTVGIDEFADMTPEDVQEWQEQNAPPRDDAEPLLPAEPPAQETPAEPPIAAEPAEEEDADSLEPSLTGDLVLNRPKENSLVKQQSAELTVWIQGVMDVAHTIKSDIIQYRIESICQSIEILIDEAIESPDHWPSIKRLMGYYLQLTERVVGKFMRLAETDGNDASGQAQRVETLLDSIDQGLMRQRGRELQLAIEDLENEIEGLENNLKSDDILVI